MINLLFLNLRELTQGRCPLERYLHDMKTARLKGRMFGKYILDDGMDQMAGDGWMNACMDFEYIEESVSNVFRLYPL